MLPSRSEYDVLHPLYNGQALKIVSEEHKDAVEHLISNQMIERVEVKNNEGTIIDKQYRITTLGRQAYEECLNYLFDERRKDETLKTAKNANKISITAIVVSASSFFIALASLLISCLH